jgi:hypothetical protein
LPQGYTKATNQVLVHGNPLKSEMEIGANATAAKMLPRTVVIFDDVDFTVKEAGAKAEGWLGVLDVVPDKKIDDAYAVGDECMIIEGECDLVLRLAASENVTRGDKLVTAGDGLVAKQAVGAMGAQGRVVGEVLESSNVTVEAAVLVHWNPSHEPAAAS